MESMPEAANEVKKLTLNFAGQTRRHQENDYYITTYQKKHGEQDKLDLILSFLTTSGQGHQKPFWKAAVMMLFPSRSTWVGTGKKNRAAGRAATVPPKVTQQYGNPIFALHLADLARYFEGTNLWHIYSIHGAYGNVLTCFQNPWNIRGYPLPSIRWFRLGIGFHCIAAAQLEKTTRLVTKIKQGSWPETTHDDPSSRFLNFLGRIPHLLLGDKWEADTDSPRGIYWTCRSVSCATLHKLRTFMTYCGWLRNPCT